MNLFDKIDNIQSGDTLIIAGNIPNTLPDDVYERIIERLDGKDVRIVVDATKKLLVNSLKYKPFLRQKAMLSNMRRNCRKWVQKMFSFLWAATVHCL